MEGADLGGRDGGVDGFVRLDLLLVVFFVVGGVGGYAAVDYGLEVAGGAEVYGVGFAEFEVGFGGEGDGDIFSGHGYFSESLLVRERRWGSR